MPIFDDRVNTSAYMTLSIPRFHKNIWFTILTAIAILSVGLLLLHNAPPIKRDIVATGFLIDIVVTFPVAFYYLLVRPLKIKKWKMLLVITCCCGVGYLILPAHQRGYIVQLRKLTAGLELGALIYALSKIRQIRVVYRQLQACFPDMGFNLHKSMAAVLGDGVAIKFMASELTVLRFGLFFWTKQKQISPGAIRFSIHKETGYSSLFGAILFACVVELFAVHLFLLHYSHTAAIIVTVLGIYGTLFIVGDFSAILKCPVLIIGDKLLLRTGLRWQALITLNDIASIEKVKDSFQPGENCHKGGLMKNRVNILFTFTNPIKVDRLYRKPIYAEQIIMTIDGPDTLIAQLNK